MREYEKQGTLINHLFPPLLENWKEKKKYHVNKALHLFKKIHYFC